MDKDWKLQRYSRKDYTDVVAFPVEIVGRDGVVRRYSFEDALRLYQRRITFAPLRYQDSELIEAEVGHCRSRIVQLRRSYFQRFGWSTPAGDPEPLEVFGDVAGELAAFLGRVLRVEGPLDVVVSAVADPESPVSTWHVAPESAQHGMVLYVARFESSAGGGTTQVSGGEAARETFFNLLADLKQDDDAGADAERLVAFHHTVDCGFLLTGRADQQASLLALRDEAEEPEGPPTPWDDALEVIRRGDFDDAIGRCRRIVREQSWHRSAYLAGAVLCLANDRLWEAEDFGALGALYFKDDPALLHFAGVARYRQGRLDQARQTLEAALKAYEAAEGDALEGPTTPADTAFELANLLLDTGHEAAARRVLGLCADEPSSPVSTSDRRSVAALRAVQQWILWRRVMRIGAGISFVLGLVALFSAGWLGLVPILLSGLVAAVGLAVFRRQLRLVRARQRYDALARGLRRIHRRLEHQRLPVA